MGGGGVPGISASLSPYRPPDYPRFILKWGGELTALGEAQSALLGTRFRNTLYPGELSVPA